MKAHNFHFARMPSFKVLPVFIPPITAMNLIRNPLEGPFHAISIHLGCVVVASSSSSVISKRG